MEMIVMVIFAFLFISMLGITPSLAASPSQRPSVAPTVKPSVPPTWKPTLKPSAAPSKPTIKPTIAPSKPTVKPTAAPSFKPSVVPTWKPSLKPSLGPTFKPTRSPTLTPTSFPTSFPTLRPTSRPSSTPTSIPTSRPTSIPSARPSSRPTYAPTPTGMGPASKTLTSGSITGIAIAVFAVICFILFYIYRTHYQYVRRFIRVNLGKYSLLHDDDHEQRESRNMSIGHETEELEMQTKAPVIENPLHEVDSSERDRDWSIIDESSPLPPSLTREDTMNNYQSISSLGITKSGYLKKQTTNLQKNWVRRWFFMKDGFLYYSRKQPDHSPGAAAATAATAVAAGTAMGEATESTDEVIAAVLVANLMISTVKVVNSLEFHIVSPGIRGVGTGGGVYCLQADTAEEADDWVKVIKEQIETYLSKSLPSQPSTSSSYRPQQQPMNIFYENKILPSSSKFVPSEDVLQTLYKANPICADCGISHPEWASINLCIMICIDCAGIHRKLGAHISKVRSLKLDKWSRNLLDLLITIGNERANRYWLASTTSREGLPIVLSTPKEREDFIRNKYEYRKFIDVSMEAFLGIQYHFLYAAKKGDYLTLMKALVNGIDVNFHITDTLVEPVERLVEDDAAGMQAPSTPTKIIPVNPTSLSPVHSPSGKNIQVDVCIHDTILAHQANLQPVLPDGVEASEEVPSLLDMTALMLACQHGHVLAVELLLLWQANLQYRNAQGLSPRDVVTLEEPARGEVLEILNNGYEAKQYS